MPTHCTLRIRRLDERGVIPKTHSDGAAGLDLSACLDQPTTINPGEIHVCPTGIAIAVPVGFEGQVRPRSGLACKMGVTVVNAPGTIDSDYRGEVRVGLINLGREPFTIEHHMRIAQLVIAPVATCIIQQTGELDATPRGAAGFGSTGL